MKKVLALLLLGFSLVHAEESQLWQLSMTVDMKCPMSEELQAFIDTIPKEQSPSFEWQESFVNNLTALIKLVQSDKFRDAVSTAGVVTPDGSSS